MDFAKKYFIPLLILAIAAITALGEPDERIARSIPIIPGDYQFELSAGFAVLAGVLAYIIYRHEHRNRSP